MLNKRKLSLIFFITIALIASINSFAFPKKIIIVRHADKLEQVETGPALSAKGQIRAIALALYFLDKYGEPDILIGTDPSQKKDKNTSFRELETLAPLANILQEKYPDKAIDIEHPYESSDYAKLAKKILSDNKYDDKIVLICWSHGKIPELAEALGVKDKPNDWNDIDFDSVYELIYSPKGDVEEFNVYHEQYPVTYMGTWKELYTMANRY